MKGGIDSNKKKPKISDEMFDYIFINPPYEKNENDFLTCAVNNLKINGYFAAIVSNGLLGRQRTADIRARKNLIENYHITKVYALPLAAFSSAEVYTSLIIIENTHGKERKTELIDLRNTKLAFLDASLNNMKPLHNLTLNDFRTHNYILLPEEYNTSIETDIEKIKRRSNDISRILALADEETLLNINKGDNRRSLEIVKKGLKNLITLEYERIACDLLLFCHKNIHKTVKGYHLFELTIGKRLEKKIEGPYVLYGAGGPYGTSPQKNMYNDSTIIIGRTGSSGNVYKAWTKGFLTDNAFLVNPFSKIILPDFLLFLLHTINFKTYRRGTGQPYITKARIYEQTFEIPDLYYQAVFLKTNGESRQKIKELELKMEELR